MRILEGNATTVTFLMVNETDFFTAELGLAPDVEISVDGGAFAATTNSASEISDGWYAVTLTAGEVTATIADGEEVELILRATASGAAEFREKHVIYENVTAKLGASDTVTLSTDTMEDAADVVWRRQLTNIYNSSAGDTVILQSPFGALLAMIGKIVTAGDVATVYAPAPDDSTSIGSVTVTRASGADPVSGRTPN